MKARSALGKAFSGVQLASHFILGYDVERHGRPLRVSFLNAATMKLSAGIVGTSQNHVIRIHRDRRIVTMAYDNGISKELLISGKREPLVSEIVTQSVKRGMPCLDIGSNTGYYVMPEERRLG